MAHKDTEVEIKIPVDDETFSRAREKLVKIAKSRGTSKQSDRYFMPSHRNFIEPRFPFEWLSIRRRGNKAILNYKHWYPDNREFNTHCDEYETVVSNPEQLERILSVLNFIPITLTRNSNSFYLSSFVLTYLNVFFCFLFPRPRQQNPKGLSADLTQLY